MCMHYNFVAPHGAKCVLLSQKELDIDITVCIHVYVSVCVYVYVFACVFVCVCASVCMCVSAHCSYATLSEAPSGLDNTLLVLLSVSHSSLFPSPWREGVKKKRRWVGGQWK